MTNVTWALKSCAPKLSINNCSIIVFCTSKHSLNRGYQPTLLNVVETKGRWKNFVNPNHINTKSNGKITEASFIVLRHQINHVCSYTETRVLSVVTYKHTRGIMNFINRKHRHFACKDLKQIVNRKLWRFMKRRRKNFICQTALFNTDNSQDLNLSEG